MKVVLQRVSSASVSIKQQVHGSIEYGLVLFLGICHEDNKDDINYLVRKITQLRIFSDTQGKMNHSIKDIQGELLLISQFTLCANTRKGNRPSFIEAANPNDAIALYETFIDSLQKQITKPIQTGKFGADMQVSLVNDGPVTIIIDSKQQ